ncbi:MAG: hypothetical protein Tp136SUR676911_54 [Prokaryotic dsDNA virus sp.]|jgi:hypothetical protein|nr:MAG: hypothetical protein Tp136SUR676911_54 [Prokaryotic dsDNA virus sp.]|tara:strand:- start:33166 stop:33630 length:465 start_codon:yes stop_codon:yes gene_type:complete
MALTLGENAYITLAGFKAWADARGYDYGTDDAAIEAAIVIASVDFMNAQYTFKGEPLDDTQVMQLPTDCVAISDVENAAAQAAWLQFNGRLFVDPASIGQKGAVTSETKQVGSLSTSTSYAEGYQYTTTYPTTSVDRLLRAFTVGGGLGSVVRG